MFVRQLSIDRLHPGGFHLSLHTVDLASPSPDGWSRFSSSSPTWSVLFARIADRLCLAEAAADGHIRLWDVSNRAQAQGLLAGHEGAVLTLAAGVLGDRSALASGGIDGTVRVWDPDSVRPGVHVLRGHIGGVRSVALANLSGLAGPLLASAGADGTVRLWDPVEGADVLAPINAHSGSALSVALTVVDGCPLMASGGDDKIIRLWNPIDGTLIGAPLSGHRGAIRSLTFGDVGGQPLLASASDDGTVRIWNARNGSPIVNPLVGHQGVVRTLVFSKYEGSHFLATAGIDGTIRFWDPRSGRALPGTILAPDSDVRSLAVCVSGQEHLIALSLPTGGAVAALDRVVDVNRTFGAEIDRTALVTADLADSEDVIGRRILARHLRGVVGQLLGPSSLGDQKSPVISIDGRWGAGKTTLVGLFIDELREGALGKQPADGEQYDAEVISTLVNLSDPIVVQFDAWRESSITPNWWTILSSINREIRRERSLVARLAMTVSGLSARLVRSPTALTALIAALSILLLFVGLRSLTTTALGDALEDIAAALTAVSAIVATAAVAAPSLFWSSPALGRLHLRADRNPLGEVVHMVTTLRRWSPRVNNSGLLESITTAAFLIVAVLAARMLLERPMPPLPDMTAPARLAESYLLALPLAILVLIIMLGANPERREPTLHASAPKATKTASEDEPVGGGRSAVRRHVVTIIMASLAVAAAVVPISKLQTINVSVALGLVVTFGALTAVLVRRFRDARQGPRRPIVLVMDELDRCQASTVVSYLETVHTLLRGCDAEEVVRRRRRTGIAPLIVLVLADGRWIRTAFTDAYSEFEQLGTPVRSLGGDFLQKLFDHTVLVPELTADHANRMLERVLKRRRPENDGAREPSGSDLGQVQPHQSSLQPSPFQMESGDEVTQAAIDTVIQEKDEAARVALNNATLLATRHREGHLLAFYSRILPPNPRLIRRVANTWGMLEALRTHLGHDEADEVVVRAAVLYVAFPTLVDGLLDEPSAPRLRDAIGDPPCPGLAETWERADVLDVLVRADGTLVQPAAIARCYGRSYGLSE